MNERLEIRTESQGRRITIDLTPKTDKAVRGLRKLAMQTTPDFFRYCLNLGKIVISAYQTGGSVYVEDKHHKKTLIPSPVRSRDYESE